MSDTDFAPLLTYFDEKFQEQDKRFDKIENDIGELRTSVDKLAHHVLSFQQ